MNQEILFIFFYLDLKIPQEISLLKSLTKLLFTNFDFNEELNRPINFIGENTTD